MSINSHTCYLYIIQFKKKFVSIIMFECVFLIITNQRDYDLVVYSQISSSVDNTQ